MKSKIRNRQKHRDNGRKIYQSWILTRLRNTTRKYPMKFGWMFAENPNAHCSVAGRSCVCVKFSLAPCIFHSYLKKKKTEIFSRYRYCGCSRQAVFFSRVDYVFVPFKIVIDVQSYTIFRENATSVLRMQNLLNRLKKHISRGLVAGFHSFPPISFSIRFFFFYFFFFFHSLSLSIGSVVFYVHVWFMLESPAYLFDLFRIEIQL